MEILPVEALYKIVMLESFLYILKQNNVDFTYLLLMIDIYLEYDSEIM